MPYLTEAQLAQMGFRSLGRSVRISDKAAVREHVIQAVLDFYQ